MGQAVNTPAAIKLLILGSSQDQIGTIDASLRNSGMAVHCDQIFDVNAFEERLISEVFDILVCYVFDQRIDINYVFTVLARVNQDLPLILIFSEYNKDLLQLMRKGAKDLVAKDNLEHLLLVIIREIGALQQRRELEILKQRLLASERRCLDLVEGSREAIAFFQDGMHVQVNPAYLQMFGFKSQADVESLPLLDIVDKSHHKTLRTLLKTLDISPENNLVSLDVTGKHKNGTDLHLGLFITKVELDGEPSLQVTMRVRSPIIKDAEPAKLQAVVGEIKPNLRKEPLPTIQKVSEATIAPPTVVTPQPQIVERPKEDNRLLAILDRGLSHNRFRLLYHSIVNLHSGGIREDYAVVARLLDENNQEIPHKILIDLARRYDKMGKIDRWIIRNAIAALSAQRQEKRRIGLFVDLSDASILDKNLLLWIVECLREYDARGSWITFQIDEKYARDNIQIVSKQIEMLKTIKCQIAIDQFGLIPNPEVMLNQIDIDYVKLFPTMVQGLLVNQQKQDDLRTIHEMLQRHNIKTIATAVEDGNSLSILWNLGIGYIQGQFPQEPSPTIEMPI